MALPPTHYRHCLFEGMLKGIVKPQEEAVWSTGQRSGLVAGPIVAEAVCLPITGIFMC